MITANLRIFKVDKTPMGNFLFYKWNKEGTSCYKVDWLDLQEYLNEIKIANKYIVDQQNLVECICDNIPYYFDGKEIEFTNKKEADWRKWEMTTTTDWWNA